MYTSDSSSMSWTQIATPRKDILWFRTINNLIRKKVFLDICIYIQDRNQVVLVIRFVVKFVITINEYVSDYFPFLGWGINANEHATPWSPMYIPCARASF